MTYRNNEEWMKYQGFKNLTKDEYNKVLLVPLNEEKGMQLAIAQKITDDLLGDLYVSKKENIASKNLLLKLEFVYDGWIDKWQSEIYVYRIRVKLLKNYLY